jgi:hypothetical protein
MDPKPIEDQIRAVMSVLGRRGTGKAKRRGSRAHYRLLAAMSHRKRKKGTQ